ncbi:glycerol-3-phosphate dehydrogenase subunit GlpB [Desulfovibrio ferrophilus]|uniref:Glycerol 3-phosphate dehydrogenase (Quinone) subunit B n=1 Tax=Desulfovibrio ferrophilus TaxID=241368 RepID=A0A2Z6AYC8_9BACT|nr:glycerol-3-phosphate dehydrogenase subunit GlpB [Desulfovibrio ferrophilus]BBD08200.1 glycerol 3-phosphate dehydrogenase (Quinone) subunit B [Desulfovibrio ferrophilus]
MTPSTNLTCDLAIVGTGIAGMAAAVFARKQGLSVVQAGSTGAISYTSGVFDVLGAIPASGKDDGIRTIHQPFAGIPALLEAFPGHPYGKISPEDIRCAFHDLIEFLRYAGVSYQAGSDRNYRVISPAGTLKHTWCVPKTVLPGCIALEEKTPTLILGFKGLKGFSARQVVANLKEFWPGLRAERIEFPGFESGELYTEQLARTLETPDARQRLAEAIAPLLSDARAVGMPAVMGMHRPIKVAQDLAMRLGVPVFEVPTMPPGVPGIRLKEAFEDKLPEIGVDLFCQQQISGTIPASDSPFTLRITGQPVEREVRANHVLLASGRFLGGGLAGSLDGIAETVFDLDVVQPETRSNWYQVDYFDPRGHAIHTTGLQTDDKFRPLDENNAPVHPRLFAAGSILAHQDWIRMKCGAGVAIATAYAAVEAIAKP